MTLTWTRVSGGTYVANPAGNPAGITAYYIDPPVKGRRRQWRIYSVRDGKYGDAKYHGNPATLAQAKEFCVHDFAVMNAHAGQASA